MTQAGPIRSCPGMWYLLEQPFSEALAGSDIKESGTKRQTWGTEKQENKANAGSNVDRTLCGKKEGEAEREARGCGRLLPESCPLQCLRGTEGGG